MTIQTKLNIGDEIYYLSNNSVQTSIVRGIKLEVMEDGTLNMHYLCNRKEKSTVHERIDRRDAFQSKIQLLDSL